MGKLTTIERVLAVTKHSNADTLDIVKVLGYECIVPLGLWKVGDLCVLIQPDTVLPNVEWAKIYRSKSSRVRAIKLRGIHSFGIVETFSKVGYEGPIEEGLEISTVLGVIKYEPPPPRDLAAKGNLPLGIVKTDEERFQNIQVPYGAIADVTLKVDGKSWSAYCKLHEDGTVSKGILGRTQELKPDCFNDYTCFLTKYDVFTKLEVLCRRVGKSLCIRGEVYGAGVQNHALNPHAKLPLGLALYSVWLIEEFRYALRDHELYIFNVANELGIATVPMLEKGVTVTEELIRKYQSDLKEVNGKPFEGVVLVTASESFKVINFLYDEKK